MTSEHTKRPEYEAPELGAMLTRMLAALVRRATAGELDALTELRLLNERSRDALVLAARGAHDGPGYYSWTEIGRELGMSRQAARQLFAGRDDD
jgi:DNA-directed RNA polymerase sigma subunit (sigma70/sigma32)